MKGYLFGLMFASQMAFSSSMLSPVAGDNTERFNTAVANACESSISRTILLSHGEFGFNYAPNPIPCALNIKGDGIGSTVLLRRFNGKTLLKWTRGTDHSGGSLRDLIILAGRGTNNGMAVLVEALPDDTNSVNSFNRHSFYIDNIIVGRESTSNTSWDYGLYLDGSKNPDGNTNSVAGIRAVYVDHSSFGGTNKANVFISRGRGIDLHLECYTPLNGSQAAVIAYNSSQSIKLNSRNCKMSS